MNSVIDIQNVDFSYVAGSLVLDDVTLRVPPAEFASIVGPNGGGKTTLVRLILGLLTPQTGTIRLFGEAPAKNRLRVGYTPQQISLDRLFPITVRDVVLTGRLGTGPAWRENLFFRYSKQDHRQAESAMEQMRVTRLGEKPFGSLSGGERQRVLIARALAAAPELLILDEPTNNIDAESTERLYKLLAELSRKTTVLMVTHELGVVSQYVQSVICVNRRVVVHPTSALDGRAIREIYGDDIRLIRHDHRCAEDGHHPCCEK